MYSLYRAWLSLPTPPSVASTTTTTTTSTLNLGIPTAGQVVPGAPDVSLHVGPGMTHFSAHKSVLSAHSGFFKAALGAAHAGEKKKMKNKVVNLEILSNILIFRNLTSYKKFFYESFFFHT